MTIRIDVHPVGENPINTTYTLPMPVHIRPALALAELHMKHQHLYYVLIYVSDNEILFLLYLSKLVQQHQYLSYERLCIAGLDDCSSSQFRHLVRSRLGGMHDSISVQNLSISWLHMLK
jgi:hypothetical protein